MRLGLPVNFGFYPKATVELIFLNIFFELFVSFVDISNYFCGHTYDTF
jgi:hypothetical protein